MIVRKAAHYSMQVRGAAAAFGSSQTLHSRVSASSSSVASSAGGVTVTSSTVNGFTQLSFTTPDGLTCSTTAPAGVWACMQGGSPVMTVPVASLPLGGRRDE